MNKNLRPARGGVRLTGVINQRLVILVPSRRLP